MIGGRSPALHAAALEVAARLAAGDDATERWIGKDALKDLSRPIVTQRAARRAAR